MAANLLELVSRAITPDAVQELSKFLGEDDAAVQGGIDAVVPALLGGMGARASTPSGASSLYALINGAGVDPGLTGRIGNVLGAGQSSSLLQLGSSLLGGLFGTDKASGAASAIAGMTGLKTGSATNLLLMVVPLVVSVLKRFLGESRMNADGLSSLLAGQRGFLQGRLDSQLTAALGLGAPAGLLSRLGETAAGAARGTATAVMATGAGAANAAAAGTSGLARWMPWVIGAVVAALLLSMLQQYRSATNREAIPAATTATPSTTTAAPPATNAFGTAAAPATPTAINLPAKVYFDTGKAEPSADGHAVIKSVAEMLAADTGAEVDLTGYTDRTGDATANQALAKQRALGVKAALEAAGVASARVHMKPPMLVELGAGGSDADARRVEIAAAR